MPEDDDSVREANNSFYAAMNLLNIDEMDLVWANDRAAICIHPGREAIVGYADIRESWRLIFSATDQMTITAGNEQITVLGDAAWVTCTETISLMTEEGLAAAAAQATNIFRRKSGEGWRMIVHHASPVPLTTQDEWPDVIN